MQANINNKEITFFFLLLLLVLKLDIVQDITEATVSWSKTSAFISVRTMNSNYSQVFAPTLYVYNRRTTNQKKPTTISEH